ncbi:MAG: GntR family transcriptional regulator [Vagococcus sp.]|uniref:GntR family transcriptional regulator n=1 Tax=Vagococcus sp. TaxID=1933889 RepID=UPI002FCBCB69
MKKSRMQQKAYDFIKGKIEDGKWENDVRIVEQDISNELNISRTPIREAINSLILEGYLEKVTNRGVVVKKQIISTEEFVERTQLLELLLSNYLFQLQIKRSEINSKEATKKINILKRESDLLQKQVIFLELLELFLVKLDNQVIKQIILKNFQQLHYVAFPNASPHYFYDELVSCFVSLFSHLEKKEFELARKDVRVFFNRVNLELIDQQF